MPPGGVSIARPHQWGNPFTVALYGREEAVRLYEAALLAGQLLVTVEDVRRELAGKHLGCWCRVDEICHGDPLLRIANTDRPIALSGGGVRFPGQPGGSKM